MLCSLSASTTSSFHSLHTCMYFGRASVNGKPPRLGESLHKIHSMTSFSSVSCRSSRLPHEEAHHYPLETANLQNNSVGLSEFKCSIGYPSVPLLNLPRKWLISERHSIILLNSLACIATGALVSLIVTAILTLNAMRRVASSLERLADTAREELPGTMTAIRLSGMEISDLTVELSDLSQEISDGVRRSAQAMQAAEVGIRRLGALASSKASSILEERANLPDISIKPAMARAVRTTSNMLKTTKKALIDALYFSSFLTNRKQNKFEM